MLDLLVDRDLIFPNIPGYDAATVLRALSLRVAEQGSFDDAQSLYDKLWEREQLGSTGIGAGVAVPHCKVSGIERVIAAVGITAKGVDFGAVDRQPVRLFFLVISPEDQPAAHLQALAAISRWIQGKDHVSRLLELESPELIFAALKNGEG